jgi:hypothetical protein
VRDEGLNTTSTDPARSQYSPLHGYASGSPLSFNVEAMAAAPLLVRAPAAGDPQCVEEGRCDDRQGSGLNGSYDWNVKIPGWPLHVHHPSRSI